MSDLKSYIKKRKAEDRIFADGFDEGYEKFKLGVLIRQARTLSGLTQDELAIKLNTKRSAISRIENHAEDMKVSTLEKVALALGKKLEIRLI